MYYCEFGYGNDTIISTEIEDGDIEYRVGKVIIHRVIDVYIRCWIGEWVYSFSFKSGFKVRYKGRRKVKLLFGIMSI